MGMNLPRCIILGRNDYNRGERTPATRRAHSAYMRWYRKSTPERHRKTTAHSLSWKRQNPNKKRKHQDIWRSRNRDKGLYSVRKWQESNPEKMRAHKMVWNAIASGKLTREPCEVCGNPKSEGHHEDYSKPLDVVWLCRKHHAELHRVRVDV